MESKSAGSSKIMVLELARFLAAGSVMAQHMTNEVVGIAGYPPDSLPGFVLFPGASPVTFFFVLSGFVMYTAHYRHFGQIDQLPHYIINRAGRIYPLYWLSVLLSAAIFDIALHVWAFEPHPLAMFSLVPDQLQALTIEGNPVAWTLRYEITFYTLFMFAFLPRIGLWLIGFWFAAIPLEHLPAVAAGFVADSYNRHLAISLARGDNQPRNRRFLSVFFAGLAAGLGFRLARPPPRMAFVLLALATGLLIWELRRDQWGQAYPTQAGTFLALPVYAFWIAAAAMAERAGILPRPKFFGVLGVLSYPIYLFHTCVMLGFTFLSAIMPPWYIVCREFSGSRSCCWPPLPPPPSPGLRWTSHYSAACGGWMPPWPDGWRRHASFRCKTNSVPLKHCPRNLARRTRHGRNRSALPPFLEKQLEMT